MFGDVGEPELLWLGGGELVSGPPVLVCDGAEVLVDRQAGLLPVAASFLPERGPPAVPLWGRRDTVRMTKVVGGPSFCCHREFIIRNA